MRHSILIAALLTLATFAAPAAAESRDSETDVVESAFTALGNLAQDATRTSDPKEAFTPAGILKERDVDGALARRTLIKEISKARDIKVRSKGDQAVVRYKLPRQRGVVREVPMRKVGDSWKLDAARSYQVDGRDLDARCRNRAAKMKLTVRVKTGAYGTSAYSFANATANPADCKNRMELWPCHNGDLHTPRGWIVPLGEVSLDSIDGIPVGVEWNERGGHGIPIVTGHAYVIHCRSGTRGRDFYVKLRVTKATKAEVEFEWTLLAIGLGAPESIHKVQKITSRDGDDGAEGLCGKDS